MPPPHRALEKHLGLRSLAAGTEAAVKPRTQLLEFGDAARRHGGLDLARQIDRRGAGTLREREDVQEGRLDARQEIVRFAEFGLGLPGEADDHVDTDKGIGHRLPHGGDALGKAGRGVPAAHETQDAVRTALERDVEMVLELGRCGAEGDDLVGQQVRLDREMR